MSENTDKFDLPMEESSLKRVKPHIEISSDKISAEIVIPEHPLAVDIEDLLAEADVVYGIDKELVTTINKKSV